MSGYLMFTNQPSPRRSTLGGLRPRHLAAVLAVCASVALPVPAVAAVSDAVGDFLPTYTGVQAGDLDVLSAGVSLDADTGSLSFSARMAAPIGGTTGALYVFGLDRGAGTQRFVGGNPSTGQGVSFDGVLILRPDGTGQFNDLVSGTQTPLAAGSVLVSGDTNSATALPLTLFPSQGRAAADYTWNLWPRLGLGNNAQISDFAPDGANAVLQVSAVPESATLALMAAGLLVLAPRWRRAAGGSWSA